MAGLATQKDPFGWFTPKAPPPKVDLRSQIGSFEEFEDTKEYRDTQVTENLDQYKVIEVIKKPNPDSQITKEEIKSMTDHGSIIFQEITAVEVVKEIVIPDVGEKLVKATELTGKATQDVAEAGWDLLKMVFGFEKKSKKSDQKEDQQKALENQQKQQVMNETAQKVTAVAKDRMVKNSLDDYRKQVNKVLGITNSYEGTMDENGQLRTDIKIDFEKAQAAQEKAAEEAKKDKEMALVRPKGKPGQGVDLRQSAMTEKTAGGSALTTVG